MLVRRYPRVFLDIELYRPPTRKGRAGFFSERTRLAAATLAVAKGPGEVRISVRSGRDEKSILQWLLAEIQPYAKGRRERAVLAGYNILALDIPFLILRSRSLWPKGYKALREALLRGFIQVDMFQIALAVYSGEGLPGMSSLYSVLRAARGLEPAAGKGTGYSVHEAYENNDFRAIEDYARQEMRQIVEAYSLLFDPGPLYEDRIPAEWRGLTGLLPRGRRI